VTAGCASRAHTQAFAVLRAVGRLFRRSLDFRCPLLPLGRSQGFANDREVARYDRRDLIARDVAHCVSRSAARSAIHWSISSSSQPTARSLIAHVLETHSAPLWRRSWHRIGLFWPGLLGASKCSRPAPLRSAHLDPGNRMPDPIDNVKWLPHYEVLIGPILVVRVRRQKRKEPTFTARDVCRALDVPHGTLNSWAFHGWFVGLDAEKTTPGKARRFTLSDLFRLAILKYLVEFGINAYRARDWAKHCVKYMDRAPVSEMHILVYRDDHYTIHLGDLMRKPVSSGALLRLTIYPAEIVHALKERLGVSAPQGAPNV